MSDTDAPSNPTFLTAESDPGWQAAAAAILANPGTTMIVGGVDVGKTSFARFLVNAAAAAGHRVAVLDADVGQSEIGPPGCVGLAFCDAPITALADMQQAALAFTGGSSPKGHLLEHAAAMRRLADMAGRRLLVIDTGGYLYPAGERSWNYTEFELIAPLHVVALQRGRELDGLLTTLHRRTDCTVHQPGVPAFIGTKPPAFRAQRRALKFAAYFSAAQLHRYSLDDVALPGSWLGSGATVAPHILKFLNQSVPQEIRVYYAELSDHRLGMMVSAPLSPDSPALARVHDQLRPSHISVTVAPRLRHLLVGLESGTGKLIGLGLLEELNFRRRELGVLTPVRSPAAAGIIRLGSLRVHPNGTEAGSLQPGEL